MLPRLKSSQARADTRSQDPEVDKAAALAQTYTGAPDLTNDQVSALRQTYFV